jgi:hypothetical protein
VSKYSVKNLYPLITRPPQISHRLNQRKNPGLLDERFASNRLNRGRTLDPEVFQLNYTLEISFYITVNTLHLYYKARPTNAVNQEKAVLNFKADFTFILPRCSERREVSSLYKHGLIRLFIC